uniref:Sec1-like protein n=1 Tax=Polytomella parva TaxID=51329 RepID=A0A7S0YFR1_9CHLO|mmetsp:Transcript_16276/g.29330  ORF Transcript_16276/g.29330 Transcript_16276/m.29330 type:complete len:775 (+) Transcript_16276:43-2367(+)
MSFPIAGKFKLPSLDSGPLPLLEIRDEARRQLLEIIDSRRGKKTLVLDSSITGPISLIDTGITELFAEHGVARIIHLEDLRLDDLKYNANEPKVVDIKNVIYIVRATVENSRLIASQIKNVSRPNQHDFSVFFTPRRTIACDRLFEEEGIYADIFFGEFPLDLLPLDDDVISLELDGSFRDCVVDGDTASLFYLARALLRLQIVFGTIPRIQGKGPAAAAVRDMCSRMRREAPPGLLPASGRIQRAVFLDREVDLVTPMLTQITFEGLIDEVTGIRQGGVPWAPNKEKGGRVDSASASPALPAASTSPSSPAAVSLPITLLNSSDAFFAELRNLPFPLAASRLQQYAKEARREYNDLAGKDLSQLKVFVKGLSKLALLDRMSDVAAPVADVVRSSFFHRRIQRELDMVDGCEADDVAFIEELIYLGADIVDVLRFLVLLVTLTGGLQKKALEGLRAEILATYGHQHILTLQAFEKSGLLRVQTQDRRRNPFFTVKQAFKLIKDEKETTALAPAHASGGMSPSPSSSSGSSGSNSNISNISSNNPNSASKSSNASPNVSGSAAATSLSNSSPAAATSHPAAVPPLDLYALYNGYAPLSVRLVQTALSPWGWASQTEALQQLPGSQFDVLQTLDANGLPIDRVFKPNPPSTLGYPSNPYGTASGTLSSSSSGSAAAAAAAATAAAAAAMFPSALFATSPSAISTNVPTAKEVVLVVFIGGVTYTEVSALRLMSMQPECPYKFVILTTKMINGRSLVQSFISPLVGKVSTCIGMKNV